jgi:hypothetical protein
MPGRVCGEEITGWTGLVFRGAIPAVFSPEFVPRASIPELLPGLAKQNSEIVP